MPDHVHLLVEVASSAPICRLVGVLKGGSSRVLRQEFPHLRLVPVRLEGGGATSGAMRACV